MSSLALIKKISERILLIRGEKVILDSDLADFYGVATKRSAEKSEVVAKRDHLAKIKFSKSLPFAFTEHGALMAASVLSSPRAIQTSVLIVRKFVLMRGMLVTSSEIAGRLTAIEHELIKHDGKMASIVEVFRQLTNPSMQPKRRIGFVKLKMES